MPKATKGSSGTPLRHNPLEHDITATGLLKKPKAKKNGRTDDEDGDADANAYINDKQSRRILQLGRELLAEEPTTSRPPVDPTAAFGFESRFSEEGNAGEVDFNEEEWENENDDEIVEEVEIDPEDLETYNKFLGAGGAEQDLLSNEFFGGKTEQEGFGGSRNLADIILSKIAAHEAGEGSALVEVNQPEDDYELPPKVVEVYTKIGLILSRYKSGKLPKPFKILPTIPHWEDILMLTNPDSWTPNAVYEATRIFVSSKPHVVQRFMEMVVLEKVREDIYENKKLNVHLFNSLKKSLYKPASFFKGFLFPMVASGTCTLLEARIVSAVLVRIHIPVLHSAAAIKGLCDIAAEEASAGTEGGGATNIFIKALLEKRYALPFQVIDGLVFHFLRMRSMDPAAAQRDDVMDIGDERAATRAKLPVIYHQCLLMFAERYRNDITEDQREALLDLLLTHGHPKIGPEIRRELLAGRGRGVPLEQQEVALDNDDTMMAMD